MGTWLTVYATIFGTFSFIEEVGGAHPVKQDLEGNLNEGNSPPPSRRITWVTRLVNFLPSVRTNYYSLLLMLVTECQLTIDEMGKHCDIKQWCDLRGIQPKLTLYT